MLNIGVFPSGCTAHRLRRARLVVSKSAVSLGELQWFMSAGILSNFPWEYHEIFHEINGRETEIREARSKRYPRIGWSFENPKSCANLLVQTQQRDAYCPFGDSSNSPKAATSKVNKRRVYTQSEFTNGFTTSKQTEPLTIEYPSLLNSKSTIA